MAAAAAAAAVDASDGMAVVVDQAVRREIMLLLFCFAMAVGFCRFELRLPWHFTHSPISFPMLLLHFRIPN